MAVKIDIPGVGEVIAENAASENTLRQLLKVLGGPASPLNPASGRTFVTAESAQNIKLVGVASAEAAEEITGLGKAAGGAVSGAFNLLLGAITSVIGAVPAFANTLLSGQETMGSFFSNFPLIGPVLGQIGGLLDDQVGQYRELTSIGASFGNNMFGITRAAAEAGIQTSELARVIQEDALVLRQFGGSVGDGAKNFARFSKELRYSDAGTRLMAMGFTTEELNNNMLAFSEMQTLYGRRQGMTQQQLIDGTIQYSKELDVLAKVTGKSRKEIEAQQRQMARDIRIQKQMADGNSALTKNLQLLPKGFENMQGSLIDFADGVPTDDLTKKLVNMSTTFETQGRNFGKMSTAEANNFLKNVAGELNERMGDMSPAMLDNLRKTMPDLYEALELGGRMKLIQQMDGSFIDAEQRAQDQLTERAATFDRTIGLLASKLKVFLLDSGVLDMLTEAFEMFVPTTEEAGVMFDNLLDLIKTEIIPKVKEFKDSLMDSDLLKKSWDKLTKWVGDTYDKIVNTNWLETFEDWGDKLSGFWNDTKELFKEVKNWFQGINWGDVKDSINAFTKFVIDSFKDTDWSGIKDGVAEAYNFIKDAFGNIKDYFNDGSFRELFDKIKSYLTDPNLLENIKNDAINLIKDGWNELMDMIPWGEIATVVGGAVIALFTNLNPWARLVSGIIAGLTALFDWETVKQQFTDAWNYVTGGISDGLKWIGNWFSNLFDFDFGAILESLVPNWVKKFLPDSLFASNTTTPSVTADPSTMLSQIEKPSEEAIATAKAEADTGTKGGYTGGGISNSAIMELVAETKKTNRKLDALNGNIHIAS